MNQKLSEIVDTIIAKMENGTFDWRKEWSSPDMPQNYETGRNYSGFNLLITMFSGFSSPYYLTFHQIKKMGGRVKYGEKNTPILFWKPVEKDVINSDGTKEKKKFFILVVHQVFNEEQITGIDFKKPETRKTSDVSYIHEMVANIGVGLKTSNNGGAYYTPSTDFISMPKQTDFHNDEAYSCTLFHELIHSTGHQSRLNRELTGHMMNPSSYSFEELIAELGACFLCAEHGVKNNLDNSATYIKGWAAAIRADKNMLYKAAVAASKAMDFINKTVEVEEVELV